MKRLLFIIGLNLVLSFSLYAQVSGYSFYVGTWKYTNTGTKEEFTIRLRDTTNQASPFFGGEIYECMVGTYTYKKNGVVILDNMEMFNDKSVKALRMPIFITSGQDNGYTDMLLQARDYGTIVRGRPKSSIGDFQLVSSGNPKQIRWIIGEKEGVRVVGINDEPPGFSIPTDIILTKVE